AVAVGQARLALPALVGRLGGCPLPGSLLGVGLVGSVWGEDRGRVSASTGSRPAGCCCSMSPSPGREAGAVNWVMFRKGRAAGLTPAAWPRLPMCEAGYHPNLAEASRVGGLAASAQEVRG